MPNWELQHCCDHDQAVFIVTIGVSTIVILAVESIQVHANEGGATQTCGGIYRIILPAGSGCFLLALVVVLFVAKNLSLWREYGRYLSLMATRQGVYGDVLTEEGQGMIALCDGWLQPLHWSSPKDKYAKRRPLVFSVPHRRCSTDTSHRRAVAAGRTGPSPASAGPATHMPPLTTVCSTPRSFTHVSHTVRPPHGAIVSQFWSCRFVGFHPSAQNSFRIPLSWFLSCFPDASDLPREFVDVRNVQERRQAPPLGGAAARLRPARRCDVVPRGWSWIECVDDLLVEDSGLSNEFLVLGFVQSRRRMDTSRITRGSSHKSNSFAEENSFALEFWRSSSKEANRKPIQTLMDEDMSKEMESRHASPSVIVKLMGLDTLPPPPPIAHKELKNVKAYFQPESSTGFQGNFVPQKVHSHHKCINEDQEFKDIFEVMETAKFRKHKNRSTRKTMLSSKRSEIGMNFVRQKFMDVKRLSTDEALQNSKEFDDALEILHSNKDLFMNLLQDPDSLFSRHLKDVNRVPPSSHPSQITVLKSSIVEKHRNTEWSKSERKYGRYSHMQNEITSSIRKSTHFTNRSRREYSNFVPHNSSTPPYMGKTETHVHPSQRTRIVVLKPSLEKTQKMVGPVSFSHENLHFGSRKHGEFAVSAIQKLHKEGTDRQKFSENVEYLGHTTKDSRDIATEIARQLSYTVGNHSKRQIASELNTHIGSGSPFIPSDLAKLNNTESFCQFPNHSDEWSIDFSSPSSHSTESSVSREARKRMSERWKMAHQYQDVGLVVRDMSTLGEMLALPDRETPDATVVPSGTKKVSDDKFSGNRSFGTWGFSLGSSSKNRSTKLQRSKSLPAKSTTYGSPNVSYRKQGGDSANDDCYMLKDVLNMAPDDFSVENFGKRQKSLARSSRYRTNKNRRSHSIGAENELPELDIYVHSEESRKSIFLRDLSEEQHIHLAHHDEPQVDIKHPTNTPSLLTCEDTTSPTAPGEHVKQIVKQLTPENEELSAHNHNNNINKEDSADHPQVDPLLSQSETSEASPLSSKECEQQSPVSVLEHPSEEESSCSGCFERISADLQGKMQLNLLKLESAGRYDEELGISISSDEDSAGDSLSVLPTGEIFQAFKDEDDRDFSYLLDMVIASGIHGADQDRLLDACYSLDYPVSPHVFDELERKYGVMASWSRSERKLLFDLVNCILAGIVASGIGPRPWAPSNRSMHTWEHEDLLERLWQMVVNRRKEMDCNLEEFLYPRWLDIENSIEVIVKEMEKVLENDFLEEIVTEFIIIE
ncbi:hypothetical protein MUK42_25457 [Musa troglodytarum]|uniref:DUF4378 domain-containing protein n=1 Tax=Musa troglodytarum TaxID=320322 RepID=A0A9E7IB37_9LILI|nr:hypothetical protein MUK42_25457 [Musa troglodytarum]